MQIRDNVRERRRERIEQLIGLHEIEKAKIRDNTLKDSNKLKSTAEESVWEDSADIVPSLDASNSISNRSPSQPSPHGDSVVSPAPNSPDPEQWWKEREKQLKTGQAPGWHGLKGIPQSSVSRIDPPPRSFDINKLFRGFTLRLVVASLAFVGIWGWFKLEMPGSTEARNWMVTSVTQDMDFQAVEAWYNETFGGSPSFLSFSNNEPDTKEVSAILKPSETAIPIKGKLVQTYAQNGTGVKIAASGDREVHAIYTGRVQQVTQDPDGGVTIILQHENHIVTVYGSLAKAQVKVNDWVETGQQLGQVSSSVDGDSEGVLYFAVQQNGEMLNPAEVITFD